VVSPHDQVDDETDEARQEHQQQPKGCLHAPLLGVLVDPHRQEDPDDEESDDEEDDAAEYQEGEESVAKVAGLASARVA